MLLGSGLILGTAHSLTIPSLDKMTRRRHNKRKPMAIFSATGLINIDISKMSQMEFMIAIIKLIAGNL